MGAHPFWVLFSSLYHVNEPPYLAGPFCVMYGYLKTVLQGEPRQIEPQLVKFVRKWQMSKMLGFGKSS